MIGSLTAPPTLAPLLSQVCRTQIQRYQRAAAARGGRPAGSSRPLRGAVGGRGSGSALLPDYFWASPQPGAAGSAQAAERGRAGSRAEGRGSAGSCGPGRPRSPLPHVPSAGPADPPWVAARRHLRSPPRLIAARLVPGQPFGSCDASRRVLRQGPPALPGPGAPSRPAAPPASRNQGEESAAVSGAG